MPKLFKLISICAFAVVIVLWIATPFVMTALVGSNWAELGQAGDQFGSINALFSGMAFAGVIIAILLQREELKLQRQELKETREELKRTAAAQELAANTANRAFLDMERPYIYVTGAKEIKQEEDIDGTYEYINYSVANYGKTPATIESLHIGANVGDKPRIPLPAEWHQLLTSPILLPTEHREHLHFSIPPEISTRDYSDETTPPGDLAEPVLREGEQFYFWVKIIYRGPFSGPHETNAAWYWKKSSGRLEKYGRDEFK